MRTHILVVMLLCLVSSASQAGTPEIPDEVNARIARTKSQQSAQAGARSRGFDAESDGATAIGGKAGGNAAGVFNDGCTIAIGNVIEDDKKIGTSARRETTVIITGDVIQANNTCR